MFGQANTAVAIPLDSGREENTTPLRRKGRNYTPHQRLILKAQALFPGCQIIHHRDGQES